MSASQHGGERGVSLDAFQQSSLIRLLNHIDGQLGLGIHREPGVSETWRGEAADLRNRITKALSLLEISHG